jgi:hypothetical protein
MSIVRAIPVVVVVVMDLRTAVIVVVVIVVAVIVVAVIVVALTGKNFEWTLALEVSGMIRGKIILMTA